MSHIKLFLKDDRYETEMETAKTIDCLADNFESFQKGTVRPGNNILGYESLSYEGHLCSKSDVPIILNLDRSGTIKKNVVGFYVLHDNFKEVYYNVKNVLNDLKKSK